MTFLADNLKAVQQRIRLAERLYGRLTDSVSLLAVSKGHSPDSIATLVDAGQQAFGENYLQEALSKISALSQKKLAWHFIGPIQSNKAPDIAQNFSWVHTVYRLKEAQMLSYFRPEELPPLNICIQVKLEDNPKKSGLFPDDVPELIDSIKNLPKLQLRGLMTLPPQEEEFDQQRQYFRQLRELFLQLNKEGHSLDTLSMGMTLDLEAAISEGATIVRIGTGLFGQRQG